MASEDEHVLARPDGGAKLVGRDRRRRQPAPGSRRLLSAGKRRRRSDDEEEDDRERPHTGTV